MKDGATKLKVGDIVVFWDYGEKRWMDEQKAIITIDADDLGTYGFEHLDNRAIHGDIYKEDIPYCKIVKKAN